MIVYKDRTAGFQGGSSLRDSDFFGATGDFRPRLEIVTSLPTPISANPTLLGDPGFATGDRVEDVVNGPGQGSLLTSASYPAFTCPGAAVDVRSSVANCFAFVHASAPPW